MVKPDGPEEKLLKARVSHSLLHHKKDRNAKIAVSVKSHPKLTTFHVYPAML